jgi:hypothetical protein
MKLTDLEIETLLRIAEDEYGDSPEDSRWTNVICETPVSKGAVGSLVKRGLVNIVGSGRDSTISLTFTGLCVYRDIRPTSEYAIAYNQIQEDQRLAELRHPNL